MNQIRQVRTNPSTGFLLRVTLGTTRFFTEEHAPSSSPASACQFWSLRTDQRIGLWGSKLCPGKNQPVQRQGSRVVQPLLVPEDAYGRYPFSCRQANSYRQWFGSERTHELSDRIGICRFLSVDCRFNGCIRGDRDRILFRGPRVIQFGTRLNRRTCHISDIELRFHRQRPWQFQDFPESIIVSVTH